MAMQTGENEQALRKILDMTRLISIVLLLLHFYYYCYTAFQEWGFVTAFSDSILGNIQHTELFNNFHKSKIFTLGFLLISLLGAKGRKDEKLNYKTAITYIVAGAFIYFLSYLSMFVKTNTKAIAIIYIGSTTIGFLLMLSGGTLF